MNVTVHLYFHLVDSPNVGLELSTIVKVWEKLDDVKCLPTSFVFHDQDEMMRRPHHSTLAVTKSTWSIAKKIGNTKTGSTWWCDWVQETKTPKGASTAGSSQASLRIARAQSPSLIWWSQRSCHDCHTNMQYWQTHKDYINRLWPLTPTIWPILTSQHQSKVRP